MRIMFSSKFLAQILWLGSLFAMLFVPVPSLAQSVDETLKKPVSIGNPLADEFESGRLEENEAKQLAREDLVGFVQGRFGRLARLMFALLGTISIIPVVIGGFQLIVSQGGAYVEKGKKTLFWGVIGLFVGLSGVVIFTFIINALTTATR
jgi:hypothetical protein